MYELGYMLPIIILIVVVVSLIKAGCEDARHKNWHDQMVKRNEDEIYRITGRKK